jgi:hypothetical protein
VLDRSIPAATVFGVQLYIAEAFGFRKLLDTSFMIAFLANSYDADPADVEKYFNALKRAQMEIDRHPKCYKHYHLKSLPEKQQDEVDVRQFGPGRADRLPALHRRHLRDDAGADSGPTDVRRANWYSAVQQRDLDLREISRRARRRRVARRLQVSLSSRVRRP